MKPKEGRYRQISINEGKKRHSSGAEMRWGGTGIEEDRNDKESLHWKEWVVMGSWEGRGEDRRLYRSPAPGEQEI
jgi:hypothetical protein